MSNVKTLAISQEEVRAIQDLRRTLEKIPQHLQRKALVNLAAQFPEYKIMLNGEELKP